MPAYNAGSHISQVVERVPSSLWPHIHHFWIINDGSTDDSEAVINKIAQNVSKVTPIHFRVNRGYGQVLKVGLEKCKSDGCRYVVCLHADGQYPPEYIHQMVEHMQTRKLSILQGSRMATGTALSGGMPLYKFVAGKALNFFENLTLKLSMSDYHSGFIFYDRNALDKIPFDRLSNSFDFDLEMIASACAMGLAVGEYPIPTRYADEASHLKPIQYGLRVLMVLVRYIRGYYGR